MAVLGATKETWRRIERAVKRIERQPLNLASPRRARPGGDDSGGAACVPCKIVSGSTAAGYIVALYVDGFDEASTGSGTCDALPLALGSDLPADYPLCLPESSIAITGGSDE